MKELSFDTGLVTYRLNDRAEVTFNPTDATFVERLYDAFDALDAEQDDYQAQIEKEENPHKIFDILKGKDTEMRGIIDGVFGTPVCDTLFPEINVYAIANGLPVWCNLLLALLDEVADAMGREQKQTDARIAKYTQKYTRY